MKVSFVIPFHNEEKNCQPVVERIVAYSRRKNLNCEIIPVDDRSCDGTKGMLKKLERQYTNVHPLYRKDGREEKGNTMGKALVAGTKKAVGDFVIWTMGDLADDVETYGKIIEKLSQGDDMVFGSRYMPGGSRGNLDRLKAFFSSWGTKLARILFAVPVHDITNAFRGFRRSVFNSIELTSSGFSISPEFAIKAHLAGYKLGEVPTVYSNRVEGASNFKLYKMTIHYLKLYYDLYTSYKLLKHSHDFVRARSLSVK